MSRLFSCLILLCLVLPASVQTARNPESPSPDRVVQLLKELTEAPGPPGDEDAVRKIMREDMKPYANSIVYIESLDDATVSRLKSFAL